MALDRGDGADRGRQRMAIELGTVAPIGFDDFPARQWLSCLRRLGCTRVQAYRNQSASVSLEQMRRYIAAGGMPCDSLHGVFGEQYDPSAPQESARHAAVEAFRREGELALELGGPLVVVHCSTVRREGVSAEERRRRVEQLRKSIDELGRFGETLGVRYAFENLPGYHPVGSDVAELAAILEDLAAPNTGLCFDTGHANMVGDAAEALRQTRGQLIYVHFCDNSGRADEHEMPTYGTLDSDALAAALHDVGYSGTAMLEVFHSVEQLEELIADGCADRLARILRIANGRSRS
jgi:sugar phosphate isomerase/epimerase